MTLLYSVLAFIVAIGVLVTVHEFGHYWVAKRLGVKVLRFSVGFGRPLLSWRRGRDDTEYVIAALPLGGYVKMLDEREAPVAEGELHRAFNRQSVVRRSAIVAAGPMANFIFAVFAYWLMFMLGTTGIKPLVGPVEAQSPAQVAGFVERDLIREVNGEPVTTWEDVRLAVVDAGLQDETVRFEVLSGQGRVVQREIDLGGIGLLEDREDVVRKLGLSTWRPDLPPTVMRVLPNEPAEKAGLQVGDVITAIDGEALQSPRQLIAMIRANPGRSLSLSVTREGEPLNLSITPAQRLEEGEPVGHIGAGLGITLDEESRALLFVEQHWGPWGAAGEALQKTADMARLTVVVLGKLLVGQASLENVSGPITIAEFAGKSAAISLSTFLGFLAVISISLGILNLLPIPVLDGGHLLYYLIEAVRGRPLSEQAQALGQKIGLSLLIALMTLAFYNDLVRLLG